MRESFHRSNFFFFNHTATTEIYTLSLHDALPISQELAKLVASWPASRPVEVWNSFAGVAPFNALKPVKKFTNRKVAVARIWKAVQTLLANVAPGLQSA